MSQAKQANSNRVPTSERLLALLFTAGSWLALLLSIPIFVVGCFDATHLTHQVRADEQAHIALVSRYAQTFAGQNRRLPDYDEYQTWVKATDEQHGTHLDGNGYSLSADCAKKVGEFCVSFLTGDVWVTYRSGQAEPDEVAIDGRLRDAWLEAIAFAGLIALAFFFRRAARRTRRSRQAGRCALSSSAPATWQRQTPTPRPHKETPARQASQTE